MKKILSVFLAGTLALSFASCDKNKSNNEPINEGTTTAMRLVVGEAGTRDISDGQTTDGADGVGGESNVTKGYFMTRSAENELTTLTEVSGFTASPGQEAKQWESGAFQYLGTTGKVNAALVVNQTKNYTDFNAESTLEIAALKDVAASTGFTMSSKTSQQIEIISGVKEDEVTGPESKNNFEFSLERLASKVQVSEKNGGLTVGGDLNPNKVAFSGLRYSVAGGAKKIYLFGDNAGARTLTTDTGKGAIYKGFKSAIHDLPATTFKNENGVWVAENERDVTKVSDATNTTFSNNSTAFTDKSLPITQEGTADDYKTKSATDGIYFYENSIDAEDINYNDITYVKFYGKMSLKDGGNDLIIKMVDKDGKPTAYATKTDLETAQTSVVYITEAQKAEFEGTTGVVVEDSDETDQDGNTLYKMTITEKPGTFYVGADNKMYLTLDTSRAAGNKTSKKYTAGKMVWKTPANKQVDSEAVVKYVDTRRNNIYSLSLTDINGIGDNYDPVDPKDPNIEKPGDNPDEPTVDEKDPVNEVKTFIKVKATILKWNLVHRGVVLK